MSKKMSNSQNCNGNRICKLLDTYDLACSVDLWIGGDCLISVGQGGMNDDSAHTKHLRHEPVVCRSGQLVHSKTHLKYVRPPHQQLNKHLDG